MSHNGIESGQGIHQKVAQVIAYELGCPLELISVQATTTRAVSNGETNE